MLIFYNNTQNMYGKRYNKHYSSEHNLGGGVLFDACHEVDYLKIFNWTNSKIRVNCILL